MATTLQFDVSFINAILAKTTIPLPLPTNVTLSDISVTDGIGYLEV